MHDMFATLKMYEDILTYSGFGLAFVVAIAAVVCFIKGK